LPFSWLAQMLLRLS